MISGALAPTLRTITAATGGWVPGTGAIQDFIPILVFAFLFGLSMDYEVFVLARMREEYDRTGSTEAAVVGALSRTGRLVTSASLILAISFLSLSTNPDLPVRVIATGLAFGILFDAFVVRTLLCRRSWL